MDVAKNQIRKARNHVTLLDFWCAKTVDWLRGCSSSWLLVIGLSEGGLGTRDPLGTNMDMVRAGKEQRV